MTTETKLRASLTITLLVLLSVTFEYFETKRKFDEYKVEAENQFQKLHDESFNANVYSGRFEMALEMFKEKDPKAAEKFELILTTQTE